MWDFARGCMRNYLILKEKAAAYYADPDVRDAMAAAHCDELGQPTRGPGESLDALRADAGFDPDARGAIGAGYDRLDQLAVEHLFGVR